MMHKNKMFNNFFGNYQCKPVSLKKYIRNFLFLFIIQFFSYLMILKIAVYNPYKIISHVNEQQNDVQKLILFLNLGITNEQGYFPDLNFLKWLVLIYGAAIFYWYILLPYWIYKYLDLTYIRKLFRVLIISLVISYLIFVLFPIEIPLRHNFPSTKDNLIDQLLSLVYQYDNNKFGIFPSLHVMFCYLGYLGFRNYSFKKIPPILIYGQLFFAILVWISTFVLKQHFVLDGLISIILLELVFFYVNKKSSYPQNIELI